jgi:hypothetical protein
MYVSLYRLEASGRLTSRWGEATAERGWRRPRIYKIVIDGTDRDTGTGDMDDELP